MDSANGGRASARVAGHEMGNACGQSTYSSYWNTSYNSCSSNAPDMSAIATFKEKEWKISDEESMLVVEVKSTRCGGAFAWLEGLKLESDPNVLTT